jgi:hypothetical protein
VGQVEKIDWHSHYRAVLVATAFLALRDAPLDVRPQYPSANGRAWEGMTVDGSEWRAVAVAAGAVHTDA